LLPAPGGVAEMAVALRVDGARAEHRPPAFGAAYFVVAVKRVRGMRLVGLARVQNAAPHAAPAPVVATHHHHHSDHNTE